MITAHNLHVLILAYAVNARIVAMQAANSQHPESQPHSEAAFMELHHELNRLADSLD